MINRTRHSTVGRTLLAGAVATVLLAACAAAPVAPDGAAAVRARLTQLQADPNLATLAPAAINDADAAVRIAEKPEADRSVGEHRVYIADRKVEIARAQAQARFAEDQRAELTVQRDTARLESRTREVDVARGQSPTRSRRPRNCSDRSTRSRPRSPSAAWCSRSATCFSRTAARI